LSPGRRTGRFVVYALAAVATALLGMRASPSPTARAQPASPRVSSGVSPFRFVDVAARLGVSRVTLAGRPDKDHLLDSAGTEGEERREAI
jgi:hypothetical protein